MPLHSILSPSDWESAPEGRGHTVADLAGFVDDRSANLDSPARRHDSAVTSAVWMRDANR